MYINGYFILEENFSWKKSTWLQPGVSFSLVRTSSGDYNARFSACTTHANRPYVVTSFMVTRETTEAEFIHAQDCAIQARAEYLESLEKGRRYNALKWQNNRWMDIPVPVSSATPPGGSYLQLIKKMLGPGDLVRFEDTPPRAQVTTKPKAPKRKKKRWFTAT